MLAGLNAKAEGRRFEKDVAEALGVLAEWGLVVSAKANPSTVAVGEHRTRIFTGGTGGADFHGVAAGPFSPSATVRTPGVALAVEAKTLSDYRATWSPIKAAEGTRQYDRQMRQAQYVRDTYALAAGDPLARVRVPVGYLVFVRPAGVVVFVTGGRSLDMVAAGENAPLGAKARGSDVFVPHPVHPWVRFGHGRVIYGTARRKVLDYKGRPMTWPGHLLDLPTLFGWP
jgi:hypothetical protein